MQKTYKTKFIEEEVLKYKIMNFLEKELERAGVVSVSIRKTPLSTRIILEVANPGMVVGRGGSKLKELGEKIKEKFGIEEPEIIVFDVKNIWLEPKLVARRIARMLESGRRVRAIVSYCLRRIMENGAIGAEIRIAGKLAAKGARSRKMKFSVGYLPKAGHPTTLVKKALYQYLTQSGVIGITVKIAPPGVEFPDIVKKYKLPKEVEAAEVSESEEKRTEKTESGGTSEKAG